LPNHSNNSPLNSAVCSANVTNSGSASPVNPSPLGNCKLASIPFGSPSTLATPASLSFISSCAGGGSSGTCSSGLISGGVNFTVDFNGGGGSAGGGGGVLLSTGGGSSSVVTWVTFTSSFSSGTIPLIKSMIAGVDI